MGDSSSAGAERLAAHKAGYSTFLLGANKRPAVSEWRSFMTDPPDEADVVAEAGRTSGYAIVCGTVSGGLLIFDFEAGFGAERWRAMLERLEGAGLLEHFDSWCEGYMVQTPGGGLHVGVRVIGDRVPGNTKLAWAEGKVIAETRGQGGYVVGPGSNGDTHPNGGTWIWLRGSCEACNFDTPEVIAPIAQIIASYDETPPTAITAAAHLAPDPLPQRPSLRSRAIGMPSMEAIVTAHGFEFHHQDQHGSLWTRPGKDRRDGYSLRINHNGRAMVFSSSIAGLPASDSRTYDEAEVDLGLKMSRLPTPTECAEWFLPYTDRPAAAHPGGEASGAAVSDRAAEPSLRLPNEFWQRPYLDHIRRAAWAGELSPDAMWEAIKAFYSATVPWNFRLPRNGTLDYIATMVGRSGSGKTMAKQEALDLLPPRAHTLTDVRLGLPPGSGEGMTESFLQRSKSETTIRWRGAGFYVDEGKWLFDVNSRAGNTTVQALKQAWSGELTGNLNATADRSRWLPARGVRASFLISAQPGVAASFLRSDLTDGGLPQRISFGWSHLDDDDFTVIEHPGILDVPIWTNDHWGYNPSMSELRHLTYDAELSSMLAEHRRSLAKGEGVFDGHADYARLKCAAILALMDDRREVNITDWVLACQDWDCSVAIRTHILASSVQDSAAANEAVGSARAHQQIATESVHLERAVVSLVSKLRLHGGRLAGRDAKNHLRSFWARHKIHHAEVYELALQRGLVLVDKAADGSVNIHLAGGGQGGSGGS